MSERTLADLTVKELLVMQVQLLNDIREGLVAQVAESGECEHPEDRRVNLSTLSDLNHWICLDCRFDSKADAMN